MAKGNIFLGDASGRVGSIVLSTRAGEMITRKYQANVKNPKSTAQMVQRARFAAAVKFYKHANQALFPFAYEDKKKTESYFNAFMRHNLVSDNVLVLNKDLVDGTFPSLANSWNVTEGRLSSPLFFKRVLGEDQTFAALVLCNSTTGQPYTATEQNYTIAGFSEILLTLSNELQEGDIVTVVQIESPVSKVSDGNPSTYPRWILNQFRISKTDGRDLQEVGGLMYESDKWANGFVTGKVFPSETNTVWAGFIITRKNSDGSLYCSTTSLACNNEGLNESAIAVYSEAVASWNPSGEAVLKGGLSTDLTVSSPALGSTVTVAAGKGISVVGTGLSALTAENFECSEGVEITKLIATSDGTSLSIIYTATKAGTIDYLGGAASNGITWNVSAAS